MSEHGHVKFGISVFFARVSQASIVVYKYLRAASVLKVVAMSVVRGIPVKVYLNIAQFASDIVVLVLQT